MREKYQFWLHIILILSLVISTALVGRPVKASPATRVYIDPSVTNVAPGGTFTVNINVDDPVDLFGYEFKLKYKTTVLTATTVVVGPIFGGPLDRFVFRNVKNDTIGYVWLGVAKLEEPGVSIDGTLAIITFTVDSTGGSCLSLSGTSKHGEYYISDTILLDSKDEDIPHEVEDGHFINSPVHDIAITSVTPSATKVKEGQTVDVTVVARNHGNFTESFNVTAYANTTAIGTPRTVANLEPGNRTELNFTWDTTDVTLGKYIISANATTVLGETDTTDNAYNMTYDFFENIHSYIIITVLGYPVAAFNYSPTTPVVNQTVFFDASNSTPNGGKINYYHWDFGDNVTSSTASPVTNHVYTAAGPYTVALTVEDSEVFEGEHLTDTILKTITIYLPPVADFTYTSLVVNTPVTFNASASYDLDGSITDYFWDFGDETNGTGVIVMHTYTTEGNYTITLTVTDNDSLTSTKTATLKVFPEVIHNVAIASVTSSATEAVPGDEVTITVVAKNKGSEIETFNVTAYYDNTDIKTINVPDLAPGASTTLTFEWNTTNVSPGAYTIKANATVVAGETEIGDNEMFFDGTVTMKLSSTISISATPATIASGESTTLNGSITPIRSGVNVTIWYRLSGEETWSTLETVATDDDSQYSYDWTLENVGAYEVKASWEGDGNTESAESEIQTITVNKMVSTISITASPTSVTVGSSTTISGAISPARAQMNVTIHYKPSGGTWTTLTTATTDSNGQYSYTWAPTTVGTHELKASWPGDANTLQAESDVTTLVVKRLPVASFTYTPSAPIVGDTVTFTSTSTDPDGVIMSWEWDFNEDGTIDATTEIATWTCDDDGTYNVTLTVTDDDGLTDTITKSITVNEAPTGIPLYLIAAVGGIIIIAGGIAAYFLIRKKP